MINEPLLKAIEIAGGVTELARRAKVSVTRITNARARGSVSPDLAQAIDDGLHGLVTREQLVWPEAA